MPRPESPSLCRVPTPPVPADTPAVTKLRQLLGRTIKVGIQDSRIFLGTFACTDKSLNVVLANTYEYRPSEAAAAAAAGEDGSPPGRYVGMVMIPWKYVQDVELQIDFGECEGDYT
jgi:small nuclear ribonucleoprotein (snRNP)-like protein